MDIARALAKSVLPPSARRSARNAWENVRDWFDVFVFGTRFMATRTPMPKIMLYFGFALGDDLLCTTVLRELRKRGHDRILMVSDHRDLFVGNQDLTYLHPLWKRYYPDGSTIAVCRRFARIWGGRFVRPEYAPPGGADRRRQPSRHAIAEMCAKVGITGPVEIRPYINLTQEEKESASWARNCVVVQSSGLIARHPARLKEWYPERFEAVTEALKTELMFVQIGSKEDPPLRHARDLRGSTNIRESAAILHQARLYIGLEGFLMHLARAVECPSIIIFGGRSAPWQLGYICNINIHSTISCAPCWRSNNCEFGRQCMDGISAADVVAATREMLLRPRNPLAVETIEIATGHP
ncbi:MAG TPA: glycosyltransferase family 9 protein [Acetobacteraceae bacterium]|nr:glycosyltransferase family 9 protein [Acetobacteraceae bacterium]HUN40101.1 glycosyltransferase family 9 protein [Acetobacteraceae bacterium]